MKSILYRIAAAADIEAAHLWYEIQRSGLGGEFLTAVTNALDLIQQRPELYPILFRATRRVLLKHFPYGLFYRLHDESIIVVACLHTSRHPGRWRNRSL
ncbi:MAG: type II toxin-antitoxin system RelE/ParE family toxin [Sulfuricaulis sp.]